MNIAVYGWGQMGKLLAKTIDESETLNLVGIINPTDFEKDSRIVEKLEDLTVIPDVLIDFSHYSNVDKILPWIVEKKVPTLIATTGHSEEQILNIEKATEQVAILKATNTSLGINLITELLETLVSSLENWDIELIEKHHNKKIDAPSGTAQSLLQKINDTLSSIRELTYGREGIAPRKKEEIGVHVVRGGTIVGEHSVIFAGEDEIIEIKHEAHSKMIFVNGAIKGATWLSKQKPGFYTMKDIFS